MNEHRISKTAHAPTPLLGGALLLLALLVAPSAFAQTPTAMDHRGNLTDMPFNLDVPVLRVVVDRSGGEVAFQNFTSLSYEESIAHYRSYYASQRELAPGWRVIGFGFDVGASVHAFTLRYAAQSYRLEVLPDPQSGGSILVLRGHAQPLGYQPQRFNVAPYRAPDVGRVPY